MTRDVPRRRAVFPAALVLLVAWGAPGPAGAAVPSPRQPAAVTVEPGDGAWLWPVDGGRVVRPYAAPAHEYGPGHRGIDLEAAGPIRAPAVGTVAFSGAVAGRGILTIDHGGGLVTTFEPVESALTAGTPVAPGQEVARPSTGGHAAAGTLHFGVRLHGEYINPLVLLGGVPRAVLLPCC